SGGWKQSAAAHCSALLSPNPCSSGNDRDHLAYFRRQRVISSERHLPSCLLLAQPPGPQAPRQRFIDEHFSVASVWRPGIEPPRAVLLPYRPLTARCPTDGEGDDRALSGRGGTKRPWERPCERREDRGQVAGLCEGRLADGIPYLLLMAP